MPRPHLAHAKKRGLGTRLGLGNEYEAAGLNDVGTDEKRYLNVLKSQSLNHPPACVEEEGGGGGLTLSLTLTLTQTLTLTLTLTLTQWPEFLG